MRNRGPILVFVLVISASLTLIACGGSELSPEEREAARQEREARQTQRELQELRRRYPAGDCGDSLFVNARTNCGFARNLMSVYYAEIVRQSGPFYPFNPRTRKDEKMQCTESSPHKCTGAGGAVVYFGEP